MCGRRSALVLGVTAVEAEKGKKVLLVTVIMAKAAGKEEEAAKDLRPPPWYCRRMRGGRSPYSGCFSGGLRANP